MKDYDEPAAYPKPKVAPKKRRKVRTIMTSHGSKAEARDAEFRTTLEYSHNLSKMASRLIAKQEAKRRK